VKYLDFTLQLSTADDGTYQVAVTQSPAGFPATAMSLNLNPEAFFSETGSYLTGELEDPKSPLNPRNFEDVRLQLGLPLSARLFADGVSRAFADSRTSINVRRSLGEDCALRLRLHFGRPSAQAPWQNAELQRDLIRMASLPWEYLCDPDTGKFLVLSGSLPIVRRVDVRQLVDLPAVRPPIRVLVASCQPTDCKPLNLEKELAELTAALPDTFEIEPMINPSLRAIDDKMREFRPHIFHFLGHGGFRPERGEGYLCFVGPDGLAERKTGLQIAESFSEHRTLRLAVLNACRGGQLPSQPDRNPFAATATALLTAGIPAVIAMQFPITDRAAIAFSAAFYSALPANEGVETAVWMGRRAIREVSNEFGTPALYLQSQDGQLFEKEADRDEEEDAPVKLAIQSFKGFGRQHAKSCDAVLDLTRFFDKRFVRDAETWNDDILRRLVRFLSKEVQEDRPLDLIVNAHQSLAFTAGYLLEAKAGISPNFYQRGLGSSYEKRLWNKDKGPEPEGEVWRPIQPLIRDPGAMDLALAISVTQETRRDVEEYLAEKGLPVCTLYHAEVPQPGHDSVQSGTHAFRLAKNLHNYLKEQASGLRKGTLHVFGAAPNAFFFFLGQHAVPWGRIQLYEFDFRSERHKTYEPSILLDPARLPERGSREGIEFLFT
jgi:hypothetical protein